MLAVSSWDWNGGMIVWKNLANTWNWIKTAFAIFFIFDWKPQKTRDFTNWKHVVNSTRESQINVLRSAGYKYGFQANDNIINCYKRTPQNTLVYFLSKVCFV